MQLRFAFADDPAWPRAVFDPTAQYRYWWSRRWDSARPVLNFLMLNPSTADAERSDPTVTRCLHFARAWGFGTLIVTNIFSYRSTDPRALRTVADPVGPENDAWIVQAADRANRVVVAWGTHGTLGGRQDQVLALLHDHPLYALGQTHQGCPRHPLYVPRSVALQPFPSPRPPRVFVQ
jgi:hypothetical protein